MKYAAAIAIVIWLVLGFSVYSEHQCRFECSRTMRTTADCRALCE